MRQRCSFVGCGKTFPCYSKLEDHMNVHLDLRPHVCDICDKSYPSRKARNAHRSGHEGRAFACTSCSMAFAHRYKLARHARTCQRSFPCEKCGRVFRRKGDCDNHMARRHQERGDRHVACEMCGATFCSTRSCRAHFRIVHEGARVHCPGCGREYSYRSSLNEHLPKCEARKTRGDSPRPSRSPG